MSELLTITEAARLSNVSDRTVRRWIARGHLSTVVHGHVRRVSAASLSEHLDRLGQPGPATCPPDGPDQDSADPPTDTDGHGRPADGEAVQLAGLVRELTAENRRLAETAAVWMERARVLDERLALMAPQTPGAARSALGQPDLARSARALSTWLLGLLAIVLAVVLLVVPR